jgi:hypothetical protein
MADVRTLRNPDPQLTAQAVLGEDIASWKGDLNSAHLPLTTGRAGVLGWMP